MNATERVMPIDLQSHGLKKALRGYDSQAVDDLLSGAAQSLSEALDENSSLRNRLADAEQQLSRYRAEESLMREALVLAQRTADETRAAAHKEAELIREAARQQASESVQDLHRQADDLRWQVERLRLERTRFADEFRAVLERYQRELSAVPLSMAIIEPVAQ